MPQKRINHSVAAVGTARISGETGELANHAIAASARRTIFACREPVVVSNPRAARTRAVIIPR